MSDLKKRYTTSAYTNSGYTHYDLIPVSDLPSKEDADTCGNVHWVYGSGSERISSYLDPDFRLNWSGWRHTDRFFLERKPINAEKFGLQPIEE